MVKKIVLTWTVLLVFLVVLTPLTSASPSDALDYVADPLPPDFISVEELLRYQALLQPGDVLLMSDTSRFSTYLIPDVWKHSALYLGSQEQTKEAFGEYSSLYRELEKYYEAGFEILVIDSSEVGVSMREYEDYLIYKYAAYRPLLTRDQTYYFVDYVVDKTGRSYDFYFRLNSGDYYCSELIYEGLRDVGFDIPRREVLGFREVVSPDDLAKYFQNDDGFEFLFLIDKNVNGLVERKEAELFMGPEKPLVEAYKSLVSDKNLVPLMFFIVIALIVKFVFMTDGKRRSARRSR